MLPTTDQQSRRKRPMYAPLLASPQKSIPSALITSSPVVVVPFRDRHAENTPILAVPPFHATRSAARTLKSLVCRMQCARGHRVLAVYFLLLSYLHPFLLLSFSFVVFRIRFALDADIPPSKSKPPPKVSTKKNECHEKSNRRTPMLLAAPHVCCVPRRGYLDRPPFMGRGCPGPSASRPR
jgi:hypothetical protein